jgi:RNA polymerase sigma-70 factor, ECF subfamily
VTRRLSRPTRSTRHSSAMRRHRPAAADDPPADQPDAAERAERADPVEHARVADDGVGAALVAERPRLVGLAYRITGSRIDAEDIVQEAWLRARRADPATIERPAAWLTTVVARLALDHLRSARHRRETYVGPWLPEPVVTPVAAATPGGDPAMAAELAESLTFGFLRVLETLTPIERVVFLLADVFDTPLPEIAQVIDRSPQATRQVASRARRRVRAGEVRREAPDDAARVVVELIDALGAGDSDRAIALLAEDAVLVSDGGPRAHAARRPVVGRDRVSRFLQNLTRRFAEADVRVEPALCNGEPGAVVRQGDRCLAVASAHVVDDEVAALYVVVNPDKLAALEIAGPMV